jgi:putative phosphoribosyl transferase
MFMQLPLFIDRRDAGRRLAQRLRNLGGEPDVVVLALPRGGVPVGYEIAAALRAPLDVFLVRKLGLPGHEELAMGAIASGGVRVVNTDVLRQFGVSQETLDAVTNQERRELERREMVYRDDRPLAPLRDATVVLVDDGIATGATMRAAITAVRQLGVAQVVVAAPVIASDTLRTLASLADRCECVVAPELFGGVGAWYDDFEQTTDDEVRRLLAAAAPAADSASTAGTSDPMSKGVRIPIENGTLLHGDLTIPRDAKGIVVFAHGSGSSRLSPRNQEVAASLNDDGFATLLFDLLTSREEAIDRVSGELRFNIVFLARRLLEVTDWLGRQDATAALPLGYFGASTGAAAALVAAGARPQRVRAVVSRGGRPDLAGNTLPRVTAPTLLIVGAHDTQVLALNRAARLHLVNAETELAIVPHATHLFEEPGAMERVSRLAGEWFVRHLADTPAATHA